MKPRVNVQVGAGTTVLSPTFAPERQCAVPGVCPLVVKGDDYRSELRQARQNPKVEIRAVKIVKMDYIRRLRQRQHVMRPREPNVLVAARQVSKDARISE
jgi:hypothetical protein